MSCNSPRGSLTIPEIYDWHLKHTPEHPLFEFIHADGQTRVINYPEACRAFYRVSHLIRKQMGDALDVALSPERRKIIAIVANPGEMTALLKVKIATKTVRQIRSLILQR